MDQSSLTPKIQMLQPQQITPGMGNPYQHASQTFVDKGIHQSAMINAATRGGKRGSNRSSKRASRRKPMSKRNKKSMKSRRRRRHRGGDIVVPPLHGVLFNNNGYQATATQQASSYINSRAAATNDGLVGKPGMQITTGGANKMARKRKTKRTHKYYYI